MRRGLILLLSLWASSAWAQDVAEGEALFRQCKSCHRVGEDARNLAGPHLNEVVGRRAGVVEGFRYSTALAAAGADGLAWTPEALDAFLAGPKGFLPGTKMNFRGFGDPEDRANLIAYIEGFTHGPERSVAADFDVSEEIYALEGDPAWGEYLSSDCTTCHQATGADEGIPSITGWPPDAFVLQMHAYKEGAREHPVMQMMAGRLSNDEIAALAAYFAGL